MLHRKTAWRGLLGLAVGMVALRGAAACGGSAFSSGGGDGGADAAGGDDSAAGVDGSDGTASADAGGDAAGDGEPGAFCATRPNAALCEDFDKTPTVGALEGKWGGTTSGTGTLAIVPGLLSEGALQASAGNNDLAAMVHSPIAVHPTSSIHLEYQLRIDAEAVASLNFSALTAIVLGKDPSNDPVVFLYIDTGGKLTLGWSDAADAGHGFHWFNFTAPPPILAQWSGRWAIDIGVPSGSMQVTHEGMVVATSNQQLGASAVTPSQMTVAAGVTHNTGTTGTVTATIDNLVLDVK